MTLCEPEFHDVPTPTGLMRTHLFRPRSPGRYPAIVFYSEIFQVTGPIRRMASMLAGHGFLVAAPEIWHEFEPMGFSFGPTSTDSDRGNALKKTKELAAFDSDATAVLSYLKAHPICTGSVGFAGKCIGGHLAIRAAALNPEVRAVVCWYATDLHKASLSKSGDNTLSLASAIRAEMALFWGRQDPHTPREGRAVIYNALSDAGANFSWHEFNAQHAFMRDEGERYDPQLSMLCYQLALDLFRRDLHA